MATKWALDNLVLAKCPECEDWVKITTRRTLFVHRDHRFPTYYGYERCFGSKHKLGEPYHRIWSESRRQATRERQGE